ncbi:biotin/lipoyl-binding protein [Hydrogenimonas sp.]|jgi:multidrug resistance efflux pump|uniref:HlyD family secretion protein n=1 Tax=Hydrogenimonas sp. TaxID=2231112 RepID=UPI002613A939|nr:biotin/lipoyl-binding protein [Hydrogenimonas sp.]
METLMLLTYVALCWAIFKIFKIPVNKWSLTTAVLGGVVLIGHILMGMAYYHPASRQARVFYITTPILPNVRGLVTEVPVKPNVPIKKGEVLFKIDETPYRAKVDEIKAQLTFAEKRLKDVIKLRKRAGGSKFDIEEYRRQVAQAKAQLVDAMFDLQSCTVRAPSDGYVTHIRVRPGQMAVPFPIQPMMTFVNADTATLIAGFPPEPSSNIHEGDEAEVVFPAYPGMTFQGHVVKVLPALAEGELKPTQDMVSFNRQLPQGLIPAIIELDENLSQIGLPMGVDAEVAVYGASEGYWSHISIVRRILLRMITWSHFLRFH